MIPVSDRQTGVLFDSRDAFYRSPVGAIPHGTEVKLSLMIPRGDCPREIVLWFSKDGEKAEEIPFFFAETAFFKLLFLLGGSYILISLPFSGITGVIFLFRFQTRCF